MARPRLITLVELQRMPAGERGPRLRALLAFHQSRIETGTPHAQVCHQRSIRKLLAVARQAGVSGFMDRI